MKKAIFFLILSLIISPCIYGFTTNTDFNKNIYYGETLDLGIYDINYLDVEKITISIFSIYENYFSNTYDISEVEDIPIVFDDQVYFNSKINYKLLDINDNIIEEKEFDINLVTNLVTNLEIKDFYLCNKTSCTDAEKPRNYNFWINQDVYVISEEINNEKFLYNITIETDLEQENQTLLSVENILWPYLIPNNSIVGNEHYKIVIEIIEKETNKRFFKNVYFALSELTEAEHREIMNEIIYPEEEPLIEQESTTPTDNSEEGVLEEYTQYSETDNTNNNKYILITIIATIVVVFIFFLFSNKKSSNRRLNRKKNHE
jgi:hypothetical protein